MERRIGSFEQQARNGGYRRLYLYLHGGERRRGAGKLFVLHTPSSEFTPVQKSIRTAANLTVTLLTHYVALKLETILDRETKISHEQLATQIEARLGSGEGETAKGPDMKVWSKGRGINDVSCSRLHLSRRHMNFFPRLTGCLRSFAILLSSSLVPPPMVMI